MAAPSPRKKLRYEATCSICMDFFTDPVITGCGHNFCRACISQSLRDSPGSQAACPQCRGRVQVWDLKPNIQLGNVAGIVKELEEQEEEEAGKWRFCETHQEPLKLFCKDDTAPICVECDRSEEHYPHNVVPLEEATREYQDWITSSLENVRKERERMLAFKAVSEEASQELIKQTKAEKMKIAVEFRQLRLFLKTQEKHFLAQMEDLEKEMKRKRAAHLSELSEELSSLEGTIREMKKECQQPADDLLQDFRSTLESGEEERFDDLAAFPPPLKWRMWECHEITPFLKGITKQFKDNLVSRLQLQKANVTLDPDTAHPRLKLSADSKSIKWGDERQELPNNPERFTVSPCVLGCGGFTAGRHFWEVSVGSAEGWAVGVARTSVCRKLDHHGEGIWAVEKWAGQYRAFGHPIPFSLSLSREPKRIRVTVNYEGGRVAFFDADSVVPIYTYSAPFAGEKLFPFFSVYYKSHLALSP